MGALLSDAPDPQERFYRSGFDFLPSGAGLGAAFGSSFYFNPVTSILRAGELDAEAGTAPTGRFLPRTPPATPLLAPQDASREFGIPGRLGFERPIREGEARLLNQWARDRQEREDILRRSTPGFLPGAARFGAAFLAGMLDPLNIAAAFIPVVGEVRWAALMGRAGIRSTAVARLSRGAIEGAVGTGLVEPIIVMEAQREQADYTMADSLLNIAFGTALGGGLHVAFGKLGDVLAPPEFREAGLRGAVAALVDGRPVSVGEALQVLDAGRNRLLSTTTISPFPTAGDLPLPPRRIDIAATAAPAVPPAALIADTSPTGAAKVFDTMEDALARAAAKGRRQGVALPAVAIDNGFVLARRSEAAPLRNPDGTVLHFTSERAAVRFIKTNRAAQGRNLDVVPVRTPEGPRFVVVENASPADLVSMRAQPRATQFSETAPAQLDPAAPPSQPENILRDNAIWKPDAEDLAIDPRLEARIEAARRPAIEGGDPAAELRDVEGGIADIEQQIREGAASGQLDPAAVAALAIEAVRLDARAAAFERAARVAAICLNGRA